MISIMRRMVMLLLPLSVLYSCNEDDPEQIKITALYPKSVKISNDFSNKDTFKFAIVSYEAVIANISLYEDDLLYVDLTNENFGVDIMHYDLFLLYNPKQPGSKHFKLEVAAPPYAKSIDFEVMVTY